MAHNIDAADEEQPSPDPKELRALGAQLRREVDPREWKVLCRLSWVGAIGGTVAVTALAPAFYAAARIAWLLVARLFDIIFPGSTPVPGWTNLLRQSTGPAVWLAASLAASALGLAARGLAEWRLRPRLAPLRREGRDDSLLLNALPPMPFLLSLIGRDTPAPTPTEEPTPPRPDLTADQTIASDLRRQLRRWQRIRSALQTITIFPLAITVFLGAVRWPAIAMLLTGRGNPRGLHEGDTITWTRGDDPLLALFLLALFGLLLPCALALLAAHRRTRRLTAEAQKAHRHIA